MAAGYLFKLIHCGCFVYSGTGAGPFNMSSALMSKKERVRLEAQIGKLNGTVKMGHSVPITANGTDYGLGDQYYVSSYFFTCRRSILHFCLVFKCWLYSDTLRCLFICPVAEPALAVSVIDQTRERNGFRFRPDLSCAFSSFVLRKWSVYPSKWSDIRRLRCARHHWPHPAFPDRATGLQQRKEGVWLPPSLIVHLLVHLESL